jgi:hypothetical protein
MEYDRLAKAIVHCGIELLAVLEERLAALALSD